MRHSRLGEFRHPFLAAPLPLLAAAVLVAAALPFAASSGAETVREGGIQVGVSGRLTPQVLPRNGKVPVAVSFAGRIRSTSPTGPPQLLSLKVELNRHGVLTYRGVPKCRMGHINPSTTSEAIVACRRALVGTGNFSANVKLPEQSPFPSEGKVLAFNGRFKGRPAILRPALRHQSHGRRLRRLAGSVLSPRDRELGLRHRDLDAPRPPLSLRRETPRLPRRRLPRPQGLQHRHLPPRPSLLFLRRRQDPHLSASTELQGGMIHPHSRLLLA